jgi:arylsulfatase A-like enzyme
VHYEFRLSLLTDESNEIRAEATVHSVDFFPTLAAAIGADIVPKDRAIDGVNQLPGQAGQIEPGQRQ